jgi:NADH:ubiquinone oxidoreductase subunit 6 (subunit J)
MSDEQASFLGFTIEDLHLVMAVLFGALLAIQAWDTRNIIVFWNETPTGNEVVAEIAEALYSQWAFPFEVLSILLLVALIGAVALAMRGEETTEGR